MEKKLFYFPRKNVNVRTEKKTNYDSYNCYLNPHTINFTKRIEFIPAAGAIHLSIKFFGLLIFFLFNEDDTKNLFYYLKKKLNQNKNMFLFISLWESNWS